MESGLTTNGPSGSHRAAHVGLAVAAGVILGVVGSTLSPLFVVLPLLAIGAGLVVFIYPEVGLVTTVLAGRFNRVPFLEDLHGPYYVGLATLYATVLVVTLRRLARPIGSTGYLMSMLCLGAVLLVSVLHSPSVGYGWEKVIEYGLYTVPLVVVLLVTVRDRESYWRILYALAGLTLFLALVAIGSSILQGGITDGRLAALGGGPNVFGRFMVFGAISSLALFSHLRSRWTRPLVVPALLIFVTSCFLTGSRQAILGMILCIALYGILLLLGSRTLQKIKVLSVASALVVAGTIMLISVPSEVVESTTGFQRTILLFQEDKGDSVNTRVSMVEAAWELFKQEPLTGVGAGGFATEAFGVDQRLYPHNVILEIMAELGLLGMGVFAASLSIIGLGAWRILKTVVVRSDDRADVALASAVVVCFVFSLFAAQVSGDLYDNRWVWLFGALVVALPPVVLKPNNLVNTRTVDVGSINVEMEVGGK